MAEKGMLTQLVRNKHGWKSSIRGLVQMSNDGECAVTTAIRGLENNGYLRRFRVISARTKQQRGYVWAYGDVKGRCDISDTVVRLAKIGCILIEKPCKKEITPVVIIWDNPTQTAQDITKTTRTKWRNDDGETPKIPYSENPYVADHGLIRYNNNKIKNKRYSQNIPPKQEKLPDIDLGKTITPKSVVDLWNHVFQGTPVPTVSKLTNQRQQKISSRIKDIPNIKDWRRLYSTILRSEFLTADDSSWFTIDWVIKNDTNYTKILEGRYANTYDNTPTPHTANNDTYLCPNPVDTALTEAKVQVFNV